MAVAALAIVVASIISAGASVVSAAPPAPPPRIGGVGGVTNGDSGIANGRASMPANKGANWNGWLVINDEALTYPITITGSFGNTPGLVFVNGRQVGARWSASTITIDPTGSVFNASQPWSWSPTWTWFVVQTQSGQAAMLVNVVPAVKSRIYGQCTYWVALRRHQMGKLLSPTAYSGYTPIDAHWQPQRGDQLQWNGTHTAIVEDVYETVTPISVVFHVEISQFNVPGPSNNYQWNQYSEVQTTFTMNRLPNGAWVVAQAPQAWSRSGWANSYYR
jgi:hypothetical protein